MKWDLYTKGVSCLGKYPDSCESHELGSITFYPGLVSVLHVPRYFQRCCAQCYNNTTMFLLFLELLSMFQQLLLLFLEYCNIVVVISSMLQ